MEFRPYYLAREWVRAGHAVTIVAASFSHVRQRQPEVQGAVAQESIAGIAYRWLPTPAYAGNSVRRALNICIVSAPGLARRDALGGRMSSPMS